MLSWDESSIYHAERKVTAVRFSKWHIAPEKPEAQACLRAAGYPYLVAAVLSARGIETPEQAAAFLEREDKLTISPFLMRDMDKAAARVQRAIAGGERIAVFGDYDVDGITATCILVDYLKSRGADVVHYIPRRIEDGYGLSRDAIKGLFDQGVRLLVTVDCGITGVEEVDYANSLGLDVVITDHHECREVLPRAVAVVDPHRADCGYPFKHLAGCGVALKLVLALGGPDREEPLFARYCTLAAIGTVADVMQMSGENRTIVSRGLATLEHSDFIGLHALLREAGLSGKEISSVQIGFVLAPRINAAGRMGAADKAAELLLCTDPAAAEAMAKELCALNRERQNVEQDIYTQAEEMIDRMPERQRSALVLESSRWHQGVVGIVASRMAEEYSCPTFLICLDGDKGKASSRSYGGFNLFRSLEQLSGLLESYGGHELAAGFTIRRESIAPFREKMMALCARFRESDACSTALAIDCEIPPELLTIENIQALGDLEPCGAGCPRPVLCMRGLHVTELAEVGGGKHLRLRLSKGTHTWGAIFFSTNAQRAAVAQGDVVDIAFTPQINEYRSVRSVQLNLVDIRPDKAFREAQGHDRAVYKKHLAGGALSCDEAGCLLPTRQDFAAVWRYLAAFSQDGVLSEELGCLSRKISRCAKLPLSAGKTRICLDVLAEQGLLQLEQRPKSLCIRLCANGRKVDLEKSPILIHLKKQKAGN